MVCIALFARPSRCRRTISSPWCTSTRRKSSSSTTTRGVTQKKALYAAIAENLQKEPGLKADDIFINLVEVKREDWSFGGGIAQYVA